MGNRGNRGWHMGSRLSVRYKVWNRTGRGRRRIWRQTWGFESLVRMATGCRLWQQDLGQERPGGETIANGHGGNSTGHGSTDHMLIGGLVAECLILEALSSDTHVASFLAVQISILAGKSSRTNFLFHARIGLQDHTQTHTCQHIHKYTRVRVRTSVLLKLTA